ncbi:MAG: Uma2 family endonuclease [Clostridiales bacterium]|nr:Uma2 family endonuclease [Clostridiales bacterium]
MEEKGTFYGSIEVEPLTVREPALAYLKDKQQGEYTLEDYYALPDGVRMELIDGVLYDMTAAPSYIHQSILGDIYMQLRTYIESKGGKCLPFMAPCDVQLDRDNRTIVQPDVMIICKPDLIRRRVLFGAPDFVVEILSPSTRHKDMFIKFNKYKNAGVREYWMVDPDKKSVAVYDLEHDSFPMMYDFKDKVPVNIYDGECKIDFAIILENVQFLYDTTDY